MAQYYDTTPWLIPKADDRLAPLFRQHGSFFSVKKGSMLDAINIKGDGHNVTFLHFVIMLVSTRHTEKERD